MSVRLTAGANVNQAKNTAR